MSSVYTVNHCLERSLQCSVCFCSALILVVSSNTVPERAAKYILAGHLKKKNTVTVHKPVLAYKLAFV